MPKRSVSVKALQKVPFFIGLTMSELRQIGSQFKERHFAPGEVIVKEGSGGAVFFVIQSGEATVSVRGRKKTTLGAFDHFGEVALIDGGAHIETVTAVPTSSVTGLITGTSVRSPSHMA